MIEIIGTELNQWDVGRHVKITGIEAEYAHFANQGDSKAVIMGVVDIDATVPDYLLQTGKPLCVYAVKDGITIESKTFYVKKRERPENYVYDEDQRNFIYALISGAQEATEEANQAAEAATQAAQSADGSATRANAAAEAAEKASVNANKAADRASQTAKSLMVIGKAEGTSIHLDDAIEQYLVGLRVFGKTTQDGVPTSDAPVDLESGGKSGKVGVSIEGKNLLDLNAATFLGCINNGGVLVSNVNNAHYAALVCPGLVDTFMACKGKTVIFSANKSIDGRAMAVVIYGKMKSGDPYQSINGKVGERFVSFRIAEDFENITSVELRWNRSLSGAFTDTTSSITDLQVEIGAIATTYEPYKGQTITIETPNGLRGVPVSTGGNYTDANGQKWICDEIDLTRGVYVQRVGKYEYTGEESWVKSTAQNQALIDAGMVRYDARVPQYPKAGAVAVLSSHCLFAGLNSYDKTSGMGVWVSADSSYLEVRIVVDMDTVDELRTWLAEQYDSGTPVTVLYILATPIETSLSEEELAAYNALHTYRGHTTVTNDASAYMELEYAMDAKKYIDGLITGTILPARVE